MKEIGMSEVTQEMISDWKAQYGYVYKIVLNGKDIIYRTINRSEYVSVMQKISMADVFDPEVETVKICALAGLDEKELTAKGGVATVVYEQIMLKSGFVQVESEEL